MENELSKMDDSWFLKAIMENVSDSIYFKDRNCIIQKASRKMAITNRLESPEELIGKTDIDLYGYEFGSKTQIDDLHVMDSGQSLIGLVESHHLENGETNWTSTSKLPLRNKQGKVIGLLGITREINDLKRIELDLQHMATHDILTTLPNRYLFFNRLEHAISRAKRQEKIFAVMYIDLDNFKLVNDQLGHDAGDRMLKEVAELMQSIVRESDTVARIGGDEFILLVEPISNFEEAAQIAQRILHEIHEDEKLDVVGEKLSASIGVSFFPQDGNEASTITKAADQAMYKAKEKKNTFKYFEYPKSNH
jgi:diguanylate cyclase (GGDEF)-like protein/PAS domain S-box-containing protein